MSLFKEKFDYVVVGVGENYKAAIENAESRLPAPLSNVITYAKVKVGDELKCADGLSKVEVKYNLRGIRPETEARRKPASADAKNLFELLNE